MLMQFFKQMSFLCLDNETQQCLLLIHCKGVILRSSACVTESKEQKQISDLIIMEGSQGNNNGKGSLAI